MDHESDRFIPGIYNYCDRWCERCRFTDRCQVFAREQQQLERHLLRGEDPEDPAVFMQDVTESLNEALGMLAQMAAEEGLELDEGLPTEKPMERGPDPLAAQTERWGARVGALLERARADMPGIGHDLAHQVAALSDREQEETLQALEGVRDAYEVLACYRFVVPVKTVRAVHSQGDVLEEEDATLAGFSQGDALGTAKLVHDCLGKAAAALWCLAEFSRDWQDEALPLAAEAEALQGQFDQRFPGHREFRRPGLDAPDA